MASSINAIAIADLEGNLTYVNDSFSRLWGYDKEELVGKHCMQFVHNREQVEAVIEAVLKKGGWQGELVAARKDGSTFNVQLSASMVRDEAGNPINMMCSLIDITRRKRAEDAVRESEARYRDMTSSIPGVVFQLVLKKDGSLSIPFISENFYAASGSSPQEIEADPLLAFGMIVPEDRDLVNRWVADSAKTLDARSEELRVKTKAGETRWVRGSSRPSLLPDGSVLWNGVVVDITRRKEMEQQLKKYSQNLEKMVKERTTQLRDAQEELAASEERLRLIFEHAGDAIIVHDASWAIRGWNRRAEETFGYKAQEIMGRQWQDIVRTTTPAARCIDQRQMEHLIAEAGKKGSYHNQEVTSYMRKDGKPCPAETSGAIVRDTKGKVIGFVSIYRDISARKRLEKEQERYARNLEAKIEEVERTKQELEHAQERLVRSEKLAAIGELAGGVGHELRNPLGAIKNVAYLLNTALEEPRPEVKESLEILEKEVERSERIIGSLLDFGRPRSPVQQMVSINNVAQVALFRAKVPEEVEVVSQLDESLPAIVADEDQLGIVFGNIVLNAIQAMPEGGKLVLKSEVLSPAWLAVSFADTGVGIPKENLEKLFEPLFTTRGRGVGLGLAIAKALAEMHGGAIEVQSQVGKGSTFKVKLPVAGAN
jgi:PAS domain S-box-containing protein